MGQSASNAAGGNTTAGAYESHGHRFSYCKSRFASSSLVSGSSDVSVMKDEVAEDVFEVFDNNDGLDNSDKIPDECLASIFQLLGSGDRKRCSLVCRRWFRVEGPSRHRLSLNAQAELSSAIPSLFSRFDSVSKLALKCDRRSVSINDDALVLISLKCRNLTRLKLRACRELTDVGIAEFAKNCTSLKKFSCGSCNFGAKGMNALLENCSSLEELSIKRLRGLTDGVATEPIGAGLAASSLKVICLKELYNGQCFGPLISGSKNLKTLKLFRCSGDWDNILEAIADRVNGLTQIHLERLQVSDSGLTALSKCLDLEILHLVKTPHCTNIGLISIAENCKSLRKLHIDGWKTNRIGDEGLIAVAKNSVNLQELVLIGVNPTKASLEKLATNCPNLERLALCGSETVGDMELCCIAEKCVALRKLCIKTCPVTNRGIEALASGCPNLVKVKVKKCRFLTHEVVEMLRATRSSVTVNVYTTELENLDGSGSETGAQDGGSENQEAGVQTTTALIAVDGTRSLSSFKTRLGRFSRRKNWVACTLRMLSRSGQCSRSNQPSN